MTAASFSREIGLSHEVEAGEALSLLVSTSIPPSGTMEVGSLEDMISDRLKPCFSAEKI